MDQQSFSGYLDSLLVQPGRKISLKKDFETDYDHKMMTKEEGELMLRQGIENLSKMQDKLYAHNRHSMLIVLQAMDAAGKDSAIKHVLSGLNPQGVQVTSFKTPSKEELDHDFLWRHAKVLPGRGKIGIFNRSHYENVLVTRVNPQFILNENLPGIEAVENISADFWTSRFKQINRFEKNLVQTGTVVIKFFLHVSKKEQKKRFLERIDDPAKNWKFAAGDIVEREKWNDYMSAYEEMLSATSKVHAPWYVLPADDKWFTRVCMADIIHREFNKIDPAYPEITEEQRKELLNMRERLMAEKES